MMVIQEIRERSSVVNVAPIKGFYCIPTIMVINKTWKVKFRSFLDEYIDDMVDPTSLHAEIDLLTIKLNYQFQGSIGKKTKKWFCQH